MNILSIISKGFLSLVLMLGFSYCAEPVEEKNENVEFKIPDNSNDDLRGEEGMSLVVIDSVFEFQKYINETKFRLSQNTKILDNIKSEFKSDGSKTRLNFEGELFTLNKKNLELKSRVNDSLKYQNNSAGAYYTEIDKEIDILESSITDLKRRSE